MIVAIYAYENFFGGSGGICSHKIIEVDSMKDIHEWGVTESINIIESYDEIMSQFESDAEVEGLEEGTDDYNEYISECINDDVAYDVWEVIPYASIEEMENDFYNYPEDFVKEHCREID